MPKDDLVTIEVPGLTVSSDQDAYSSGVGFITFVGGKFDPNDIDDGHVEENADDTGRSSSKEARVSALYREKVYYPFIKHIRMNFYGWDGVLPVPGHLKATSWMDGANSQMKDLTEEDRLRLEKELKIDSCKHSAARTAVEQAADTSPVFKTMKKFVQEMNSPNSASNRVYHFIDNALTLLELSFGSQVVKLPSHKRKAILITTSKLPSATGRSHTTSNVRKGFMMNGQIDIESELVPSVTNALHTFQGDIDGTCLQNKEWLMEKFYSIMFKQGMIPETLFGTLSIPPDTKLDGTIVEKQFSISQENRQRAKIISSLFQIAERNQLIYTKRTNEYLKQKQLYNTETDEYSRNRICKEKLVEIILQTAEGNDLNSSSGVVFADIVDLITLNMLKKHQKMLLNNVAKSFIRVRVGEAHMHRGRLTYRNVPSNKSDVLLKLFEVIQCPVRERFFSDVPLEPVLEGQSSLDIQEVTEGDECGSGSASSVSDSHSDDEDN